MNICIMCMYSKWIKDYSTKKTLSKSNVTNLSCWSLRNTGSSCAFFKGSIWLDLLITFSNERQSKGYSLISNVNDSWKCELYYCKYLAKKNKDEKKKHSKRINDKCIWILKDYTAMKMHVATVFLMKGSSLILWKTGKCKPVQGCEFMQIVADSNIV